MSARPPRGLSRLVSALARTLAVGGAVGALAGPAGGAESRPFSERYPTLSRRNIFDPERSRPRSSAEIARPLTPPPPPRREILHLLGVALTETDAFAHLSGPDAPAVVRAGDRIGALRVVEIRDDAVVFESEDRQWTLPVGRRLTRIGTEDWTIGAGDAPPDSAATATAGAPPAAGAAGDSGAAATPGGMSETMRRLIERRQREMGR